MNEMKVTMLLSFSEKNCIMRDRDKSTKLKFDVDASQHHHVTHLEMFPDNSVIEATFVLKEVGGKEVTKR